MSGEHNHEHGPDCDHGNGPNPLAIGGVLALVTLVVTLLVVRRRNTRRKDTLPHVVDLLSSYGRTVSERAHALT